MDWVFIRIPDGVLEKRPSVGEVWIFLDPTHNAKYVDSILTTLKKKWIEKKKEKQPTKVPWESTFEQFLQE